MILDLKIFTLLPSDSPLDLNWFKSVLYGNNYIQQVMTKKWFLEINSSENFNFNFKYIWCPSLTVVIDETIVKFKGEFKIIKQVSTNKQIAFIQCYTFLIVVDFIK
jgi:hypothetical protein